MLLDSEERRAAAGAARTAEEMWQALGADAWVVVPIGSTTREGEGHQLEGTRLTVVKLGKGGVPEEEGDARWVMWCFLRCSKEEMK